MIFIFDKWHAAGNDFIVIFSDYLQDSNKKGFCFNKKTTIINHTAQLCSRASLGIGADGILYIDHLRDNLFDLTIINKDGSLATNCGNGLRIACLASFDHYHQLFKISTTVNTFSDYPDPVIFSVVKDHTDSDKTSNATHRYVSHVIKSINPLLSSKRLEYPLGYNHNGYAKVQMEIAKNPDQQMLQVYYQDCQIITVIIDNYLNDHITNSEDNSPNHLIKSIKLINTTNHHVLIEVDDRLFDLKHLNQLSSLMIKKLARDQYNIHLIKTIKTCEHSFNRFKSIFNQESTTNLNNLCFDMITFERGVGITKGCGSAAVASVVSQFVNDFRCMDSSCSKIDINMLFKQNYDKEHFSNTWQQIQMLGGTVWVKANFDQESSISCELMGSANYLYRGKFRLE